MRSAEKYPPYIRHVALSAVAGFVTRLECLLPVVVVMWRHILIKNVKSGKGSLTRAGLLKFVKRFEETGKLEDRA
ncbi:hypothetical protein TNCV_3771821 [Trichonephila clavipes]|nr:hypothetical protein TNCV_3771821 [Trichonephila clavipes]